MSSHKRLLDFDVETEPWNKYILEDGSILKTKFVLKKVEWKGIVDGKTNFGIDGLPINVVLAAPELKGTPDNRAHSPIELKNAIDVEGMKYEPDKERWNEYNLTDGTIIRVKTTVIRVSKTAKFDRAGDPIYLIETNAIIDVKSPKPLSS